MNTRIKMAIAGLCLAALTTTAAADTARDMTSKLVHYADLNVSSEAGARALYRRIRAAADDVCKQPFSVATLLGGGRAVPRVNQCFREAVERAVQDVNAPALTSYHLARTGRSVPAAAVAQRSPQVGER